MSELVFGSGKHHDRDRGVDGGADRDVKQTAVRGLGASGRIWAGRQCDNGQTFCRGFVRRSAGDVIGATMDSGKRSHTRRRLQQDWESSGHSRRLDAIPGGPQPALGECSRGKQQWLFDHNAVILPSLSGGDPAWTSPLKSTARALAASRLSPTRVSPPLPIMTESRPHQPGVNVTTKMAYGRDNRPLRLGRNRPGLAEAPGVFEQEARVADMAQKMRAQKWDRHKQRYEWTSDYDA